MFRIILLVFIFLYFNGNFFYWFTLSYIPFKNAQSINIYNMYKVFEDTNFNTMMNNAALTGATFQVTDLGRVDVEKLSSSWVILKIPHKVNHRYGDQVEILVPIIDDTGNLTQNDTQFDSLNLLHKNHYIQNGLSYLKFWIDYDTIKTKEELNSLTVKNLKTIYLNKLYLIRKVWVPNSTYFLR